MVELYILSMFVYLSFSAIIEIIHKTMEVYTFLSDTK